MLRVSFCFQQLCFDLHHGIKRKRSVVPLTRSRCWLYFSEHGMVWRKDKLIALTGNKSLIPGRFNKYVAWGYPDHSLRVMVMTSSGHSTDRYTDEVYAVHESLHDGQISCAFVTDDGQLLITGGEDAVVSIWKPHPVHRFHLLDVQANLCGHTQVCLDLLNHLPSPRFN